MTDWNREARVRIEALGGVAPNLPTEPPTAQHYENVANDLRRECLEAADRFEPAPGDLPPMPLSTWMTVPALAAALGVPERENAVDCALRRFADGNRDCVDEVANPRRGETRFMYRVPLVWGHLLNRLPRWREGLAPLSSPVGRRPTDVPPPGRAGAGYRRVMSTTASPTTERLTELPL